jgi:hypothetical protein
MRDTAETRRSFILDGQNKSTMGGEEAKTSVRVCLCVRTGWAGHPQIVAHRLRPGWCPVSGLGKGGAHAS